MNTRLSMKYETAIYPIVILFFITIICNILCAHKQHMKKLDIKILEISREDPEKKLIKKGAW